MLTETPLISMIVAGLVLAFIFGAVANRFRLPPLVGYLVAGVVVGPYTPGFVGDTEIAMELSEIGIILLMFGVGLHFSLKDLLSVQALAVPGALLRMAGGTAMGVGLGLLMGWSLGAGLLFGLALSVASTVVLLKALHDRHLVDSERGRIAVGWVIVEDIAMVLALVLIPALNSIWSGDAVELNDPFVNLIERLLSTELGIGGILAITVIKLAAFAGFMLVVGRRLIPMILHFTAHTGSRELFRLAVLALALGVAAGSSYLFGVSLALGAFFAGMILSESELSHRAAQETLPLRDAFSVLFFVAVGMLFDPSILVRDPLPVLGTLFVILVGKSLVAFLVIVALRRPVAAALTITASLAQIGEFSFILATLGLNLGILPAEGRDLIIAGAMISIILNPALFWLAERLRPGLEARFRSGELPVGGELRAEPELVPGAAAAPPAQQPVAAEEAEPHPTTLSGHTVLIGYGRVGTVVGDALQAAGTPFLVIDDAEGRVAAARAAGIEVIEGNAATRDVLDLANVEGAQNVVIAIPNAFEAGQATEQCRKHNPNVLIVARGHSDEEEEHLLSLGANTVILGEREIGLGMVDWITRDHKAAAALSAADAVEAALGGGLQHAATEPAGPVMPSDAIDATAAAQTAVASESVTLEDVVTPAATHADPWQEDEVIAASAETVAEPMVTPPPAAEPFDGQPGEPMADAPLPPPATGEALFVDVEPPLALTEAARELEPETAPPPEALPAGPGEDAAAAEPEEPELEPELEPEPEPEQPAAPTPPPSVFKPRRPATLPAVPFNPEVPPGDDAVQPPVPEVEPEKR